MFKVLPDNVTPNCQFFLKIIYQNFGLPWTNLSTTTPVGWCENEPGLEVVWSRVAILDKCGLRNSSLDTGDALQKEITCSGKQAASITIIYIWWREWKFIGNLDTTSVIIQGPQLFRSEIVRKPLPGTPAGGVQSSDCVPNNMNHSSWSTATLMPFL